MKNLSSLVLVSALPIAASIDLTAQINFTGPDGGLWSNSENWSTGTVPAASDIVRMSQAEDRTINVDGDFTVYQVQDGFAPGALSLDGAGSLTIDINKPSNPPELGLDNATGEAGGNLQINGTLVINNSAGNARTTMRNGNSASNIIRFNPGSNLVLTTGLQTVQAAGGSILFNGNISGDAPLFIGSTNASFGEGHDSTELGSVVFFRESRLRIDGGTVLSPNGTKFQVNGINAELELNAANAVNEANISIAGSNSIFVDVNANQENMGFFNLPGAGQILIDVDASVTNLSFRSNFFANWGSGSVSITGFKEDTIRFGTDGSGLTREQLAVIDGGIYSLTSEGFLTEASVSHWARFEVGAEGFVSLSPWIESDAYVETAPFIWIDGAGWHYMDEAVGVTGDGWFYAYDLDALELTLIDGYSFGYSFTLNHWVYLPYDIASETEAWLYLL